MNSVLVVFLSLSVSGSILALILLMLKPLVKNRLSQTWQYYIWLIVILRFLLPFTPQISVVGELSRYVQNISNPPAVMQTDSGIDVNEEHMIPQAPDAPQALPLRNAETEMSTQPAYWRDILSNIWMLWIAVALVLFICKVVSYRGFVRFVNAGAQKITDAQMLDIYKGELAAAKIKRQLPLYENIQVASPMLVGIVRPALVIPILDASDDELRNILRHELTHYRRLDYLYKWLVQITLCLHWFNPLVYLIDKQINKSCELSCDEAVVRYLDEDDRIVYGDALMVSLKAQGNYKDFVVSITMSENGNIVKERLDAIVNYKKKSKRIVCVSLFLTALVVCSALLIGAYTDKYVVEDKQPEAGTTGNLDVLPPQIDELDAQNNLAAANDSDEFVKLRTGTIPKKEYEAQLKQREEMDSWLERLNRDIYSDYYYSSPNMVIQITDVTAFSESPAMKEAEENGWEFDLEEVRYSENEIDALITKIQLWDRKEELQIIIVGASQDKSSMSIGTTSLSTQNRAIIEEYVGIGTLEFYNPEIANEVTGTGEYRMMGLDGIIDWYIPRLFDKPFVYNVLVKGSAISAFSNGDKPDWNFYLQYDSATTDKQMSDQIENKLMERYDTKYDPNAISYTIEPVPVERVG